MKNNLPQKFLQDNYKFWKILDKSMMSLQFSEMLWMKMSPEMQVFEYLIHS